MSNEIYGVWRDEMRDPNLGAIGTPDEPIIDVFASVKVPDGLWAVFGKMDLDNNSTKQQLVDVCLHAGSAYDHCIVRLAPDGFSDHLSVSLMLLASFPGVQTGRVNDINIGLFDKGEPPRIKGGRIKIIAMRVNQWIMERYPD